MIVAVASGKGGTGKTTVATNLARVCAAAGRATQYLDCDVEEPNGHIFLKPQITQRQDVTVEVPEVDASKCTACGACGRICQYSAIVCLQDQVLTFESLCHSCGGCWLVCPSGALRPKPLKIGEVESGTVGALDYVGGRLEIGHVRTPAMIGQVKTRIRPDALAIIDVPPGTSCPVVAALKGVDFVLLVTEPTPFGLNDLKLAVELVREMGLPFSVVINRDGIGNDETQAHCTAEKIDIVARLPDDRRIAQAYSSGHMIIDAIDEYAGHFRKLATAIGCLE
ncbi:MAG: ATP-binding protein [Phycisphaerae bacterium]|nr:ATP-binding protein [Phycisphaerae bacterium]